MEFTQKYFLFVLLILMSIDSKSQERIMRFESIEYDQNFPQSKVSKITQSKDGFIWLGTQNGLVRYDGYNFLRFYANNKNKETINNNSINDIYEDSLENIWIGTNHGLNLYNKETKSFKVIDLKLQKGGRNYISSIIEDDYKNIWIGTYGGVKKLNKKDGLLEDLFDYSRPVLNNGKILSLFYDKEYGVFVGSSEGLKCFDPITSLPRKLPKLIANNTSFLKEKVLKIIKDESGDLWLATENSGVFFYSKEKGVFINYKFDSKKTKSISSNNVKDILSVKKGVLCFATDNGFNIFHKETKNFTRYKHEASDISSISENNLTSLFKDKEGSIWLGSKTGSINFFNGANTNFNNIGEVIYNNFGLNNTIVNAIIKDKGRTIWVGTNGGGLNYIDLVNKIQHSYSIKSIKGSTIITALANKDQETILCGTFFGLFEFNKTKKKFTKITPKKVQLKISSICVNGDDIWVGTDGDGLLKISKEGTIETYKKNEYSNSISDNFITAIENRKDGLWISTQYGLNYFDKKTKQFSVILKGNKKNNLFNNSLTTLFTDSKERLWIGMDYGGLNYFDEKNRNFYLINELKGFTDGAIKSISEDQEGNLWVSSNNLLFEIKEPNLELNNKKLDIISYAQKDGINVKNYSTNSSVKLDDNTLVFGGTKGVTFFEPNTFVTPTFKTNLKFTKFIVNNNEIQFSKDHSILNKDISESSEINLNYDQKFIGFEFSALSFINIEKNQYAYKLDKPYGKDTWHNIGDLNKVSLAALESGSYNFQVKSLNNIENKKSSSNIASVKIIIHSPWWKTNLAYFIYLVIIISGIVFIISFIKSKLIIEQALISKELESERIEKLHNMKLDFFTNISHEIRTPLTLIQGPLEEIIDTCEKNTVLEKKLKNVKKNTDRLLSLINELLDFRKIESKQAKIHCEEKDIVQFCYGIYESFINISLKKNIDYKFVMSTKSIPAYFDVTQMEKVIYNLLSNAFKFTKKNGKIVILIEDSKEKEGWLFIKIKDNGIGIPKESKSNVFKNFFQLDERGHKDKGSGIGLALSKTIVELHKGILNVETEEKTWANTVFKIALKKGRSHLKDSEIVKTIVNIDESQSIEVEEKSPVLEILKKDETTKEDNRKTILFIDDVKEIRTFIYNLLIEEYNVIQYSNAKDALDFMENQIPDLIICDVMMPEMDGFEFCNIIKTNESTNHIPVILLTAKASVANRIDGLALGVDAYITKPFSVKVLKLNIVNLLSSKEILRQKYSGSFIVDSNLEKLDVPEEVFIKKLMGIIESNIEKPDFDVNELVNEIGMSRSVLYKKVKTLTNHSVASLIKHIRLKKAADILKSTNYPISEVSYLVGFNDRKYFSKEFKKIYSVSPTEYKNNLPT